MKLLQNKSTGEIGCLICSFGKTPEKITIVQYIDGKRGSKVWYYNSLAELNDEWEDYEEPKGYWYIDISCNDIVIYEDLCLPKEVSEKLKQIGNYFETKEEAELAVRKLKAWQRLKDNGFRFVGRSIKDLTITYSFDNYDKSDIKQMNNDLDLLFGGEE